MNIPRLSVCILTYNRATLLKASLESVLVQNCENFEVIVCDDASKDDTPEVMKTFHDHRLRYVRNSLNQGQWENSNQCLHLARGEFIIFMTDDDMMMQGLLRKEVEVLEKFRNVVFTSPGYDVINSQDNIIGTTASNIPSDLEVMPGLDVLHFFLRGQLISGHYPVVWIWPAVMMRKASLLEVGGFLPGMIHGDERIMNRLSMVGDFCQIREILFKYRYHKGSVGTAASRKGTVYDEYFFIFQNTLDFARELNIPLAKTFIKDVWKHFARKMVSLNGALGWTAARYQADFCERTRKIVEIFLQTGKIDLSIFFSLRAILSLMILILMPRALVLRCATLGLKAKRMWQTLMKSNSTEHI